MSCDTFKYELSVLFIRLIYRHDRPEKKPKTAHLDEEMGTATTVGGESTVPAIFEFLFVQFIMFL